MNTKHFNLLLFVIILVNALGMSCDIFNGDSALYASIAKNIAMSGDYIHLNTIMQPNWIDKPHFSFWIWSLFIQLFGNNSIGFKLPSFLFYIILLRYTYLFSIRNYSLGIAQISTIILASSLHIIIANNDVRIDMMLIALMMGAIYHFQEFIITHKNRQAILGCIYASTAIMTKGIFIVIPIGISIVCTLYKYSSLKKLFSYKWIVISGLIILGITPALYVLNIQFKTYNGTILGQEATNYLQFFFWDSQFGRFNSNLGQVQSNGDIFFYTHTLLWAMAPWSLLFLLSFFIKKNPFKELVTISCATALFIILSISKTQLSHHILVLLPFMSIMLGVILSQIEYKNGIQYIKYFHYFILSVIVVLILPLSKIVIGNWSWLSLIYFTGISLIIFHISQSDIENKLALTTIIVAIYLGLFLNTIFYPEILNYQSGRKVSQYLNAKNINEPIAEWYTNPSLLNYYTSNKILSIEDKNLIQNKKTPSIIYSRKYALNRLNDFKMNYEVLDSFADYRTTVLSLPFIEKSTRKNTVETMYLINLK